MKKYLILFLLSGFFAFTSCSDDDDADVEPIVGTWILQSIEPNTLFDPEGCGSDSTLRILRDNTLIASLYFQQNNCGQISGAGTWQKTGTSSYIFNFPEIGEVEGTATFPGEGSMLFTTEDGTVFNFQLQL